jgi:hypothetical protein
MNWRTPAEVARAAGFMVGLQALILAFLIAGTHGWLVKVPPNTVDYASFYAAGALADAGRPLDAYDDAALQAAEERATEPGVKHEYFFNPPTFLLVMAPLARLPYLLSFCLFELLTGLFWLTLGTRVAGGGRAACLALMAVPSFWWVLGEGQNSFLSAGLMAAGMLALPKRPGLAGVAFGALCYKPQLGLMIPVALLAARQWRALCTAAATVAASVGAVTLLCGIGIWRAFLAMAQNSVGGAIDSGKVLFAGRVDPTGAAQFIGFSPAPARLIWVAGLLVSIGCVAWLWRRAGTDAGRRDAACAGLAASVLVATPFALFYDLVMASLAAAWLVRAGRRDGFLAGERFLFGGLMLANLLSAHAVVAAVHVPFGLVAAPALLGLAIRRARVNREAT